MTDQSNSSRSIVLIQVVAAAAANSTGRTAASAVSAGCRTIGSADGHVGPAGATTIRPRHGRGDWPSVPSGRAERLTSDLANHDRVAWTSARMEHRRKRHQYARVGPLDCAGRSPGRDQDDHLRSPRGRGHSWLPDNETIVYRDLSGRVNSVHTDGRAFSLPVPDGQEAIGPRFRLRRRPLRRLFSNAGEKHLACCAQRRRRGQTHQWL